ncbi:MAG: hypothetical protein ABI759_28000 [Candidatus Solibacter sp.]
MHLRIRRWVLWWFGFGVICGVIALSEIMGHEFTTAQDKLLLALGAAHWLLGGIVCWAFASVKIEAQRPPASTSKTAPTAPEHFSHPASDFLLPGGRRSLLPWRH